MNYSKINIDNLLGENRRILITGGAGFIGTNLIIRLLENSSLIIYSLDKLGYASSLRPVKKFLSESDIKIKCRFTFLKIDLSNPIDISNAIKEADPDFIIHLAAESHVDRSIVSPDCFIKSNIVGTFNLLTSCKNHYENLILERKLNFKFLHVSTDEVFGSLGSVGRFSEITPYAPRSPYSASKASSDHL